MANYYGSIDLTVLGKIIRQHPELIRKVNFRNGEEHQMLNIDVFTKEVEDQYGNTASIKVSCKKESQKQGLNYYVANLRKSQFQDGGQQSQNNQQQQQQPVYQSQANTADDLPF